MPIGRDASCWPTGTIPDTFPALTNRYQEPTVPHTARPTPLAFLAVAALTITACEKKAATNDSAAAAANAPAAAPAAPAPAPAPAAAGVTIVSPKDGDTTGADVTVVLSKEGPVSIEKAS